MWGVRVHLTRHAGADPRTELLKFFTYFFLNAFDEHAVDQT